jgi:hypothetical protein
MEHPEIGQSLQAAEFIYKYLCDDISEPEQRELNLWKERSPFNTSLFNELTDPAQLSAALRAFSNADVRKARKKLLHILSSRYPMQFPKVTIVWRIVIILLSIMIVGAILLLGSILK